MNTPKTLQEAVQMLESANNKIKELSEINDTISSENLALKKKSEDLASEVFGLKSSIETDQKLLSVTKQKLSKLQEDYDVLLKKDMDVESRASAKAAQITGESGIETPIENVTVSEEPDMEEISDMLNKANGREKAILMGKYGNKISEYLKNNR